MRYENQICDGCGKPFEADDDIVVCPECATPQHRDCYNKNSCCVNSHKHGENFSWHGSSEAPSPSLPEISAEKVKTIPCPNCGYENPSGSERCKQCSMKFTLFGFNVVDAVAKEDEMEAQGNHDIPAYQPPFTLGEGEGFEENTPQAFPEVSETEQELTDAPVTDGFSPDAEQLHFGGPFPNEDMTCSVPTNLLGAFIGSNAMRYIEKFKRFDMGKKLSFNWAAFFFAPYWFFYRKLIKPGIVFMTLILCVGIVSTPYVLEFYDQSMILMEQFYTIATEAEYNALMAQFQSLYTPVMIFGAIQIFLQIICGFLGDVLYKNYAVSTIKSVAELPDKKHSLALIMKKGGASPLYALFAILAGNLLSTIASYLM